MIARSRVWRPAIRRSPIGPAARGGTTYLDRRGPAVKLVKSDGVWGLAPVEVFVIAIEGSGDPCMELSFWAATDVGKKREVNEDNFLVDKKLSLFVVADGMGGHASGEVASQLAVHEFRNCGRGGQGR